MAGEGLLREGPLGSEPNGKPQGSVVMVTGCPSSEGRGVLPPEEGEVSGRAGGGRGLDTTTPKESLAGQLRFFSRFSVVVVCSGLPRVCVFAGAIFMSLDVGGPKLGPEFLMGTFRVFMVALVFAFHEA